MAAGRSQGHPAHAADHLERLPPKTLAGIEAYLGALEQKPAETREVLTFALLCVLESVSYTRKDGQYLRWDERAGKRTGAKPFRKAHLPPFAEAIGAKLNRDAGGFQIRIAPRRAF